MRTLTTKQLLEYIGKHDFYIYGNGAAAHSFYMLLEKCGSSRKFLGFIVTERGGNEKSNVYNVNEISDRESLILVAVHDVNIAPIEKTLRELGFKNYYNVYPNRFELELGKPISVNKKVKVKKIVDSLIYRNVLKAFLDYIDGIMNEDLNKCNAYKVMMKEMSSYETGKRKEEYFCKKIKARKNKNELNTEPIYINESGNLCIDGMHRLSLAYYFGDEYIMCNIYADERFESYESTLSRIDCMLKSI